MNCILLYLKCTILDEEEHAEAPFAYQINQGERPTLDSSNLSSALYHLSMAKKLMIEKTKSDIENHDAASLVIIINYYIFKMIC